MKFWIVVFVEKVHCISIVRIPSQGLHKLYKSFKQTIPTSFPRSTPPTVYGLGQQGLTPLLACKKSNKNTLLSVCQQVEKSTSKESEKSIKGTVFYQGCKVLSLKIQTKQAASGSCRQIHTDFGQEGRKQWKRGCSINVVMPSAQEFYPL